jgi:L-ascorbate metabolism protein UlaG (beta-lactamase superfamily)
MLTRRALLMSSLAATACGSSLKHFEFDRGTVGDETGLKAHFMGVCCFYIEFGGIGLMTDPFWSHLSLRRVAFGRIGPDPRQIDPYLPSLGNCHAVLVGHNHYDHVMDLPYVIDKLHPEALIGGSRTLVHTFAPMRLGREWHALNDRAASVDQVGAPLMAAGGRLRILAIRSGHPAQYLGFHLFRKQLSEERSSPPTRVGHYQEGLTLAYLVDWLNEEGSVAARVYIQTSSRGDPDGFFPASVLEQAPVDLAVLAMDCANKKAKGETNIIDFIQPKAVIFCHWEDFFRPKTKPPREIVKVNLPKVKAAMPVNSNTQYYFPYWDSEYRFKVPG